MTRIVKEVERRKNKPLTATDIALYLGKVLGHYKMGKHFAHQIEDRKLSWWRRVERIEQEAKWDGIYVIRTSETAEPLSAADTVRGYKRRTAIRNGSEDKEVLENGHGRQPTREEGLKVVPCNTGRANYTPHVR